MSRLSFSGLSSGLNTDVMIEQLSRFNQRRIDILKVKQVDATDRQAAFKEIQAKVLSLDLQVRKLSRPLTGPFDVRKATSSDESLVKVAANGSAQPGTHAFKVTSLAKAHIVAAEAVAAASTQINTGTLQISTGSGTATVTIDSTNNTLQGLSQAINNTNVGVQASIVKDNSGYRLLLTSQKTGTANGITLTNNLTTGSAVTPNFSQTVQAASDASVQIGSGAGAITVTDSSNTFTGVIPGVTVSLQNADVNKEVTVTIANDTEQAKTAIKDFVEGFNSLMDMIDTQTKVDPNATQQTSLSGNRRLVELQAQIRSSVLTSSSLLPTNINRLSALGIKLDSSGRLSVDDAKLDSLLSGSTTGTSFNDVKKAFAISGESTNSGVTFVFGSNKTKETTATAPYQVDISQAATQATLTATNTIGASTVIDGTNNTFSVKIGGVQSNTITLGQGTYTRDQLATELQAKLAADSKVGSQNVSVSVSSDKLVFTSAGYGSAAKINTLSGTAVSTGALGLAGTESVSGTDVIGSFVVNGKTESATGSGQVLTGLATNSNTADMRVVVNLSPTQVGAGVEAELKVTRGVAARLQTIFEKIVDPVSGRLKSISDGLSKDLEAVKSTISREEKSLQARQTALIKQFSALEDTISKSKANGDALTNSLAGLIGVKK